MHHSLLFRIRRRLRWEYKKFADTLIRHFYFTPTVLSDEDTVKYVIDHHASMARFGDGELNAIFGASLNFQKSDAFLGEKLSQVFNTHEERLLLCIPDVFENLERYNRIEQNFWHAYFYFNRSKWYKFLKKNCTYGNTFVSRFYSMEYNKELAESRIPMLKRLWDNRNVVFIEGKDTKMGVGNDLFNNALTVKRIICPSKDAFSKYNAIMDAALQQPQDVLFVLALGPTATVLAADLYHAGYQALDLGHMDIEYEWYRMGATQKVPIQGKFTNEAVLTGNAKKEVEGEGNLDYQDYEKQIICTVL